MKYKIYISILILAVISWSCEDKITLDVPDGGTKLVVDGTMKSTDSIQKITLSQTNEYFSNTQTPRVSGAVVEVHTDAGNVISFEESNLNKGEYMAAFRPTENVEYTLHLTTPDGEEYRSTPEQLLRVSEIDSLYQTDSTVGSEDEDAFRQKGYVVLLATREPEGRGDYYRWIIYVDGVQQYDPFNLNITSDLLYDGRPILDWDIYYEAQPGETVTIEQMSISERAYNFWVLVQQQLSNFGTPFDTPPAPIEGNMVNVNNANEVVLGYFGVCNVSKKSIVIEDLENK